jgi:4-carboxymuconolactone decarboxylase
VTLAQSAPALGARVGYAFGTLLGRPGLDLRTREIATVAMPAALGGAELWLSFHVRAALQAGATAGEVVEALTQVGVYAAIPRALNAVNTAVAPFEAAGPRASQPAPRAVVVEFLKAAGNGDRDAASGLVAQDAHVVIPRSRRRVALGGHPVRPSRRDGTVGRIRQRRRGRAVECRGAFALRTAHLLPPALRYRSPAGILVRRLVAEFRCGAAIAAIQLHGDLWGEPRLRRVKRHRAWLG